MSQTPLVLVTLTATLCCFFAFGVYSVKSFAWKRTGREATFPGANMFYGSPAQVTEKYQLSIYPAPWAISIIWPAVLFWHIAALIYLLYRNVSGYHPFHLPQSTFGMWTGAWILTTVWTFLFDTESHVGTFVVVLIVVVFSCLCLIKTCQIYHIQEHRLKKEVKSGQAINHPFRYLVVEAQAVISMWSVCAFAISIGYALAYRNSLTSSEPIFTGLMSPEESATMGAIFILMCFMSWWLLDTAYWGERSDCIRTMYPGFALVMLSLGLSNYTCDRGMTLNNVLCFGMSALSTIALVTRKKMKTYFLKNRHGMIASNGTHRD